MPQESGADLLSLLLGPTPAQFDPRAGALIDLVKSGQAPGDQTSNVNTILDLLSPSATQDFVEKTQPFLPTQLDDTAGLSPHEAVTFAKQALGLEASPGEQLRSQADVISSLPEFMNAMSRRRETDISAGKLNLGREKLEEDRRQFDAITPSDTKNTMDALLKSLALGVDLQGKPVSDEIRKRAFQVLRGTQSLPGLSVLLSQLVKSDDPTDLESFISLTGLPLEVLGKGIFDGSVRLGARQGLTDAENAAKFQAQALEEVLSAEEKRRGLK